MVYDLFPYNGERQILEIRLNELKDVVDHFYISQSLQTTSGRNRPIHPVRDQFADLKHKIHMLEAPPCKVIHKFWEREWIHRNYCKTLLPKLGPYDFLIYGDVDEIPRAAKLEEAKQIAFEKGYCSLQMAAYYYYLNVAHLEWPDWSFPVLYHGPAVNDKTANHTRWDHVDTKGRMKPGEPHLKDAGWHFTYQGGTREVVRKLKSFGHAGDPGVPAMIYDYEHGIEPFDRDTTAGVPLKQVPIDSTFPRYVQENFNALAALGFIRL